MISSECNGCEYQCKLSHIDICTLGSPCPHQRSTPMTNEEWIKSLDTEGLVDYLFEVHKGGASVERQPWIEKHKERIKMQIRGWLKEKHHG